MNEEKNFDKGRKKRKPNNKLWKKVQEQNKSGDVDKIEMLDTVIFQYWELPKEVDDILIDLSVNGSIEVKRKLANLMASIPPIPSSLCMGILKNLQEEDDQQIQNDLENVLKPLREIEESIDAWRKQVVDAIPKDLFAKFADQQAAIQRALAPIEETQRTIQELVRLNIPTEQLKKALDSMDQIKFPDVQIPKHVLDTMNTLSRYYDFTYSNIARKSFSYYPPEEEPIPLKASEHPLIIRLKELPPGQKTWSIYQKLCEEILSFCFIPPLSGPLYEEATEDGGHRRDIIYNIPHDSYGFWAHIKAAYNALSIIVDPKNYSGVLPKDQIVIVSKYFGPKKLGNFGIIICRNEMDASGKKEQIDRWIHYDQMIICLTDNDLEEMIGLKLAEQEPERVIDRKIRELRAGV